VASWRGQACVVAGVAAGSAVAKPKFVFAQVTFIKGAYWVQVYANSGKIAPSRVLALGHVVYSKLP